MKRCKQCGRPFEGKGSLCHMCKQSNEMSKIFYG